MKIAIISDTHDNAPNIKKAINYIKEQGIKTLIHCGDMCAPVTLVNLTQQFGGTIHFILGNVDGDPYLIMKRVYEGDAKNVTVYKDLGEFELDGQKIAITHYPNIADKLAKSGEYDAVFYGHNHTAYQSVIGKTLLANPGNLADLKNPASLGIYDTKEKTFKHIILSDL